MKLALVYPPFYAHIFNENLPTVDDEFGLFPHIGFGWVARAAKSAGWEVKLWDCAARKMPLERLIEELRRYNPDLVGFAAHACQTFRDTLSWAEEVKAQLGLPILAGGYEAKAYPDEIMEHACFDFLFAGEATTTLPKFFAAFEQGHGHERVPDLYYRDEGRVKRTFPGPHVPFSDLPSPDRSIFPNHLYYSHVSQRRSFTIGMSEVGCPYPCSFCCMRSSGFDARSPEQIVAEMEECLRLGIREIDWFDPLMLHDRQRAMDIAREVKRKKLDIIWSCRSRVDSLSFHRSDRVPDEEMIRTLAEGGCRRIYFGVESGDDEVLKQMFKGQRATSHLRKVLECVADHGIMSLGFFILGAPGDTWESAQRTIEFSLTLPLAYAQYQLAIIKPHTELERKYIIEATGLDYWREYMRGTVGDYLLPTPWTELTRPELERLAREAYFRFYGRPKYAFGMLKRIESMEELVRYGRVGAQMLIRPLRPKTGESLGASGRSARAAATFSEALLTWLNPGARHPVFSAGGGVKGAWSLAKRELDRKESDRTLNRETADAIKREMAAQGKLRETEVPHAGKYVTVFDQLREAEEALVKLPPSRAVKKEEPEPPELPAAAGEAT